MAGVAEAELARAEGEWQRLTLRATRVDEVQALTMSGEHSFTLSLGSRRTPPLDSNSNASEVEEVLTTLLGATVHSPLYESFTTLIT